MKSEFKANIWKMYIFEFFRGLHFVAGVLIPFFTLWGGITLTEVLVLQSVFMAAIFIFEIPTGAVADRFGRKASLALSCLIIAFAVIWYSHQPGFWVFAIGEIMFALGLALYSGAGEALVYDSLKTMRIEGQSKRIIPRLKSAHLFGIGIGAPIGSVIAEFMGLQYTMMLIAVPMVLGFLVALTLKEPKHRGKGEAMRYWDGLVDGVNYLRKHPVLRTLAIDNMIVHSLAFFIIWLYQPVLMLMGVPIIWYGLVHSGMTAGQIGMHDLFGRMEQLFGGKAKYLRYSAMIAGICFILLALNKDPWLAALLTILIGVFGLTRRQLIGNYVHKHVESKHRATVISAVFMGIGFIRIVLNPIIGAIADHTLSAALVLVGLLLVGAGIFSRITEEMLLD